MAQNKYEYKHLEWLIRGALYEYYKTTGQTIGDQYFDNYFIDTINKVMRYLKTGVGCDASFSDFQCGIALEAEKLFGEGATQR